MTELERFYKKLESYKKENNPEDEYYNDRLNHCALLYKHIDNKLHIFNVRGWGEIKDDTLRISVVNWTLCAGPAELDMNSERTKYYVIIEDESEAYKLKELVNNV